MTVRINPRAHMIAATIVGTEQPGSAILDDVARQVLMVVRAEAAKHRLTGAYMHNLDVVVAPDRHGKDRLVRAKDPAAIPIEFGHWSVTKRGRRVSARFVPGLHIMRSAYAEAVKRVRI